ncbi:hypothetical protein [Chamaesiphon sp. VAR_48_metabat_403]|uniref:hypothetical protein n=1 Tax=Chamaesiphon sp. VAR_48_metabat_403 TaxID=2964700 RepID=UPI00286DBBE5|nr:hypothetical protein [Chamaesiphon sp. VAR_48_metabat_403]
MKPPCPLPLPPLPVARAIVQYRATDRINNLIFLTKLKCGIGKTKLSALVDRLSSSKNMTRDTQILDRRLCPYLAEIGIDRTHYFQS